MPFDGQTYTGDPILAVIDRVDQLICDEDHWGQGDWGGVYCPKHQILTMAPAGGGVRHCPRTALFECEANDAAWDHIDNYFTRAVNEIAPEFPDVPAYNNAPERTFEDIKALIRKARELRLDDIMETVDAI